MEKNRISKANIERPIINKFENLRSIGSAAILEAIVHVICYFSVQKVKVRKRRGYKITEA
jgi:hypothetical protein